MAHSAAPQVHGVPEAPLCLGHPCLGARDALTADNEAVAPPTKVNR